MSDLRERDHSVGHGGEPELYGPEYYRTGLGPIPYDRSEPHWGTFFGKIADDLIRVFRPRTVFDAGCAKGFLVEALWDRGVEAKGRDISEFAISQTRPDIASCCEAGSLADPIVGHYDLVVNIEVLEHMTEADACKAIANMAAATDKIVFSSSPDDFNEATHINVRPTIYWLKQFRDNGFAPIVDLTLPTITVYALAYERRAVLPSDEELAAVAEVVRLRMFGLEHTNRIGLLSAHLADAQRSIATKQVEAQALHMRLVSVEEENRKGIEHLESSLDVAVTLVAEVSAEASSRHASTLDHLNTRIAELIRIGLAHAERIEVLEAYVSRADALTTVYRNFLADLSEVHVEALATVDATSHALDVGAAAYAAALDRLHTLEAHLASFKREMASIQASTSWRATSSLRRLRGGEPTGPALDRFADLADLPAFPPLPTAEERTVPLGFDAAWYTETYPDVADAGMSPFEHYRLFGKAEGRFHRRPPEANDAGGILFDRDWYLAQYADVASAGDDPLQHFLLHGQAEGRLGTRPSETDQVRAAGLKTSTERSAAAARVWAAAGFDAAWYAANHRDVASDPDPMAHYLAFGLREGRAGSLAHLEAGAVSAGASSGTAEPAPLLAADGSRLAPELDRDWYFANNKDVRESGGDPELHYVLFGKAEGRAPNAGVAEQRRVFRLQDFCNPYEAEVFTAERDPDFVVSILTPTYNTAPRYLRELYQSIANQRYGHWEWVVVDDGSTAPATLATLRDLARSDDRIRLIIAARNGGISRATNMALEAARGTHCALVDHDDLLSRDALVHIHREWQAHRDVQLFYTDECKLLADGSVDQFWAKPAWSPAYLENTMCIGHLSVYETGLLRDLGFRSDYDGTQDYDVALRASLRRPKVRHIPVFAYLWRIIPGSSAADLSEKSYAVDRQRRAVLDYARQICPEATVAPGWGAGYWRIKYPLASPAPLLSYVIPTGAGRRVVRGQSLDLLTNCIRSFDAVSFYPNREYVVVHNGDLSGEQLALLGQIPRVKLVHYDRPSFNFSEKLNLGVANASGEYLCLVNDDVEAITPYGGEELVSYLAYNPQAGCVGPLCLREDEKIQQNGVLFLPGLGPVHAGDGESRNFGGHQHRFNCRRESVVIGGAMVVIRKSVYEAHEGYDVTLPLNYNDVDFGLRLAESGLSNIIDPGVEVFHFESSTKAGTSHVEQEVLFSRGRSLNDPYFSPWFDPSSPNMRLLLRPWSPQVVHFGSWLDHEIARRARSLKNDGPRKFSVCVSIYNQSRELLRDMYTSFKMQTYANREIVLFDNGSTNPETAAWLAEVAAEDVALMGRAEDNLGIMGANRELLKLVSGDFLVAMDADDFMAADALAVLADAVERHPTAKLLYTDEYKSDPSSVRFSPFYKPDFDPVLLMNCCYPAHLMAMSIPFLHEIGAYADDRATWSHDWDTLTRALAVGVEPVHVRGLTYAWRINPGSTASAETGTKPGTVASQKFVLDRLLSQRGLAPALRVEPNTIETSSGMWKLVTDEPLRPVKIFDAAAVWGTSGSGIAGLRTAVTEGGADWIAIMVVPDDDVGLLALSAVARLDPRIRAVSGLAIDENSGALTWSGGLFLPGGLILDPYAGHRMAEGGYHGQLWCQRCVDVAAPVNVLIRVTGLRDALEVLSDEDDADALMTQIGLLAHVAGDFVAVTPHLQWIDSLKMCPLPMDRCGTLLDQPSLVTGGRWYNDRLSIDQPYASS